MVVVKPLPDIQDSDNWWWDAQSEPGSSVERRWESSQAELLPVPYRSKSLLCLRNGDADSFVDKHEAGLVTSQTGSWLPFSFFLFLLFLHCET